MIINVTQDDIKEGITCSPSQCPVARAVSREFPNKVVSVRATIIFTRDLKSGKFVSSYPIPHSVRERIRDFDCNRGMPPFSFELEREEIDPSRSSTL